MEPSGSEEPALEKATVRGEVPLVGVADARAVGAWLSGGGGGGVVSTRMVRETGLLSRPPLSLTLSVAVYVPGLLYVLLGLAAVEVVPSPKFQE